MRLLQVTGTPFYCECRSCGRTVRAGDPKVHPYAGIEEVWADADGKPFVDFYCKDCKPKAEYDERQKKLDEWHHGRGRSLDAADAERKRRGEQ